MPVTAALDMPGWVIDCGYLRRQDPWEDVPAPAPIRTAAIAAPPPARLCRGRGRRVAAPENVEAIRRAVDAIPPRFLRAWIASGGRLEIVPGSNASIHPRFSGHTAALGWCQFHGPFCAVAGDHADSPLTAVHEVAHGVDFAFGYPSRSAEWLRLWGSDKAAGKVPSFAGQREAPAEYWAEQFGRLFHETLFPASVPAQEFILGLV